MMKPAAWIRGVRTPSTPHGPEEYHREVVPGEDEPEGEGWVALYRAQPIDIAAMNVTVLEAAFGIAALPEVEIFKRIEALYIIGVQAGAQAVLAMQEQIFHLEREIARLRDGLQMIADDTIIPDAFPNTWDRMSESQQSHVSALLIARGTLEGKAK